MGSTVVAASPCARDRPVAALPPGSADHLCYSQSALAAGLSGPVRYQWLDATGSVVADGYIFSLQLGGPISVVCVGTNITYDVDPTQPHCAAGQNP
jgi:hypothetical protein